MIAIGPLLILLALLGAPLFAVIAASAMLGYLREGIDLQALAIEFYGIAEMPILLGGIPAWLLQAILPVGFGLIAYRYTLFVVRDLRRLAQPKGTA